MRLNTTRTIRLDGEVVASPSKSYTHRAVLIASMSDKSRIENPLFCDDTTATMHACRELGAKISERGKFLDIKGFKCKPVAPTHRINLGESGTTLRFMLPIASLAKGKVVLDGEKSLRSRSNRYLVKTLQKIGIDVKGKGKKHTVPLVVKDGKILGGEIRIRGDESSQFISSLLITCPKAENNTVITVAGNLVSKPYINMTLDVLKKAGVKIKSENSNKFFIPSRQEFRGLKNYEIHGDYSSAAFLMVAACLIDSDVRITNLVDDKQGDKKIIDILRSLGAKIKKVKNTVHINGPFELKGTEINCRDTPDLVPVLAVLGAFAKGTTKICDIAHIRGKESDRISGPSVELRKLGVKVKEEKDAIVIKNSTPKSGVVWSHNDHRVAMALSLIGLKVGKVVVEGGECISKSYPNFVKDMKTLGANIGPK